MSNIQTVQLLHQSARDEARLSLNLKMCRCICRLNLADQHIRAKHVKQKVAESSPEVTGKTKPLTSLIPRGHVQQNRSKACFLR